MTGPLSPALVAEKVVHAIKDRNEGTTNFFLLLGKILGHQLIFKLCHTVTILSLYQ